MAAPAAAGRYLTPVASTFLAGAVTEISLASPCSVTEPCRDPLGSVPYVWTAFEFVAMALPLLAFLAPRPALVAGVVTGLALAAGSHGSQIPAFWLVVAALLAVAGVIDLDGRRYQRRLNDNWAAPHRHPALPRGRRLPWDQDTRPLAVVVAALLICTAVGLTVVHAQQVDRVRRFESVAVRVDAVVVADDGDRGVVLGVQNGQFTLGFPTEAYPVGSTVPVLLDRQSRQIALVAEPRDPSWLLGLVALAGLAASTVLSLGWTRGQRRAALISEGGPSIRLVALGGRRALNPLFGDLVSRRPSFGCGELVPLHIALGQPRAGSPRRAAVPSEWSESGLTDEQMRHWAGQMTSATGDDPDQVFTSGQRAVTVVGQLVDGYPLLVLDRDEIYLSFWSVRDPWRLLPALARVLVHVRRN